jgi:hypothetical protein
MEAPHLPMSTASEQGTSQQSNVIPANTSVAESSANSETSRALSPSEIAIGGNTSSGNTASVVPGGEPELPPMRSLLFHQSEQDLDALRQQQAERAAGMQMRWMQGNAVAAPFFPAFDAPPVHPQAPPSQWLPPPAGPVWPLLNQQQQWGPALQPSGYAAAPRQDDLVEQLLQQELEQQQRLELEVAEQRAWAHYTGATSASQQTLATAAPIFAPAGAQLQQYGGLWLGNDTQLLSRPLPPCVANSFDSITTTRRHSYNDEGGLADSNSNNFYGDGSSYAALDAFADAAISSSAAAAASAAASMSSSSSYAPMDVSTVPGFGWSDSAGNAGGSHEYSSSGSIDEGDGDSAVVWTMRGAQQRQQYQQQQQQQQQQQLPTNRPAVHRVSSSTSSGSSPQQYPGKSLRRSSECLLTTAGAAAAAAAHSQESQSQPTRRRSSNTAGMRRKATAAALSTAAALRRHSAPASDAATATAAAASAAAGDDTTGAPSVRRSSRFLERAVTTVKSEESESKPAAAAPAAAPAASSASTKGKVKSRAVKDDMLLSLSPLTVGSRSSSDATTAAAAAAAVAESSSAAAARVAKESLRYGPVYDMRNARYQRSLHTTRSWLLDEIYDYHTTGVFPVRLKDRPDSSSRRRDFKSAASRYMQCLLHCLLY